MKKTKKKDKLDFMETFSVKSALSCLDGIEIRLGAIRGYLEYHNEKKKN